MGQPNFSAPAREVAAIASLAAAVFASACAEGSRPLQDQVALAPKQPPAALAAAGPVCQGTGAHDRHAALGLPQGCTLCHPCGGAFAFPDQPVVLPGGATTSGGVMTKGQTTTTCSVGCHNPFGAPAQTVSWNTPGPLPCVACHANVAPAYTVKSQHPGDFGDAAARATCLGCHDTSRHLGGTVWMVGPDGTPVQGSCPDCHSGTGQTLNGKTPPLLVGYTDTVAGDYHGARAGTGWGGSLKAPYTRGQAPLPCSACHASHTSANAFIFAATVNGTPIPAGAINRAGVGAQVLCESCHQGERHAGCLACHAADPMPAGNACFYCHGHEGIRNWPKPGTNMTGGMNQPGCLHCHAAWMPALSYVPPVITNNGLITISGVSATGATITWDTDKAATSYVEYGPATPGIVAGSAVLEKHHVVTITGLSEHTLYLWRVRTSDGFRNLTFSPVGSFTTAWVDGPLAPAPIHQANVWGIDFVLPVTLRWNPVTTPDGDLVQYRVQIATNTTFASLVLDSPWQSGTSFATTLPTAFDYSGTVYYWRVMARDAGHDRWSPWSTVDTFGVYAYDPNEW